MYGQPGARRGARDRELALGVGDPGEPGRREHQGVGEWRAEQRRLEVDLLDAAQHARAEPGGGERRPVGGERALVLGAAVDVVEHPAGEPPLGDAPEVVDRRRPGEAALDGIGLDAAEADDRPEGLEGVHGSGTSGERAADAGVGTRL